MIVLNQSGWGWGWDGGAPHHKLSTPEALNPQGPSVHPVHPSGCPLKVRPSGSPPSPTLPGPGPTPSTLAMHPQGSSGELISRTLRAWGKVWSVSKGGLRAAKVCMFVECQSEWGKGIWKDDLADTKDHVTCAPCFSLFMKKVMSKDKTYAPHLEIGVHKVAGVEVSHAGGNADAEVQQSSNVHGPHCVPTCRP